MVGRALVLVGLMFLAGCGGSDSTSGPGRDAIVIEAKDLGPFSIGGSCAVRVTFRTRDEAILRLVIRWRALDAAGREIGDALVVLFSLPPNSRRQEDSTAFFPEGENTRALRCAEINRFERFAVEVA